MMANYTVTYWFGRLPSRTARIRWWTVRYLMPWRRIRPAAGSVTPTEPDSIIYMKDIGPEYGGYPDG
jgi:hypothetical protein